ncbi:hypothetical protein C4J83_2885 [Pseudomonas sp. LBUM920]|jgi:hypothetical protein|nr:hypothetical protein C4J83_2885 [Pseudomonas sp. LBUM920]
MTVTGQGIEDVQNNIRSQAQGDFFRPVGQFFFNNLMWVMSYYKLGKRPVFRSAN